MFFFINKTKKKQRKNKENKENKLKKHIQIIYERR